MTKSHMNPTLKSNETNGSPTLGELFVVATPIGNLEDMVPRAVQTLQSVDLIAAEDTRHSARLLQHFNILTPMKAYHDYSSEQASLNLIERLQSGQRIALISDAGTPLISDPGYKLVALAREAGIKVTPIPGACALIAALCASGLPTDRFRFEGFLPAKSGKRETVLKLWVDSEETIIFYESPHRILSCLEDFQRVLGASRELVLARELTKTFETFLQGSIEQVLKQVEEDPNQRKGEMVLMLAPAEKSQEQTVSSEAMRLMRLLSKELPPRQAAGIAAEFSGDKKKSIYEAYLLEK